MALKAILPEIDDLPEEIQSLYAETKIGDKTAYVLNVEDLDNHPKVRGVITANQENKRKAQERLMRIEELEERLSALPEDFDPDEYERLKAGQGKPDEALQAERDRHIKAVESLKAKHAEELAALKASIDERDSYIDAKERDEALRRAMREVGIATEHEEMLLDHLGKRITVQRLDDGSRKAVVETDLGDLSVNDFVKEWAGTKGKPYLAKTPPSDAPGNNGGGPRGTPKRGQMTMAQKAEYIAEHGQEAFLKLPS